MLASWRLLTGECLDVLATLEPESVDACVTDPPYGIGFLGREWDTFTPDNRLFLGPRQPQSTLRRLSERTAKLCAMPKEQVEIHLRYEGPDVDDGTMSLQDIVPVLQGFSSAYGKLAATDDPRSTHRLKIAAVRSGSADIVLEVWTVLGDNAAQIAAVSALAGGAFWIIKKIAGVVQIKRHVQRRPFKERIAANNSIVISNADNVTLEIPLDVYELFKSGGLDKDLNRLTSPLVEGRIDAAEIEARSADGNVLRERITVEERPYFESGDLAVTSTRETWLVARLNSLTKSTDSGWLYLNDGTQAFYRYVGDDPQQLHAIFGTYDGLVRVRCTANMDENLKVVSLDMVGIERVQGQLFNIPDAHEEDDDGER